MDSERQAGIAFLSQHKGHWRVQTRSYMARGGAQIAVGSGQSQPFQVERAIETFKMESIQRQDGRQRVTRLRDNPLGDESKI